MAEKILDVPYLSQLDNAENPYGSCNVTSIAMCLAFLGVKGNGCGRLPDQLYRTMLDRGLSRHSPQDLAYLVNEVIGCRVSPPIKDEFRADATTKDIVAHIQKGFPVVVHGYFTGFGHIVTIVGYNERGFVIHDPYGEWFSTGYRTDLSGEGLTYSYGMIRNLCEDSVGIWAHFVER